MRKSLVTGAAGFIGSHLTEALVRRGDRVRVFLRYNSSNSWGWIDSFPPEVRKQIDVVRGDLKDADAVRKSVKGMDAVFHLGALIAIPYSYVHPNDFVQTNVSGTMHVLQGCLDEGVSRLVHTSTSEVYGTARQVPITEEHPLQGQSPYSASKIGADKLAESFHLSFRLPVVTVRPFNTFGPRQSSRAVIPTIATQVLTASEISLGALDPVRDLTYVDDTVAGFLAAAECDEAIGQIVNLGTGTGVTIGELAKRIVAAAGKSMPIRTDPQRLRPERSEVMKLIADAGKAKRLLQWEPRVSLDEGLKRTLEWVRENLARFKTEIYNL